MLDLLILLRYAQFHYHNLHLLSKGPTSQQDHLLAGEFYGALEDSYDTLAEIMIGLDEAPDLVAVHREAAAELRKITSNEDGLTYARALESEIRSLASEVAEGEEVDDGVENFMQDLCQQSLGRSYKLNARLG